MKTIEEEKMWTIPCDCGFVLGIEDKNIDEISAGVWGTINCPNCKARLNPKIQAIYEGVAK